MLPREGPTHVCMCLFVQTAYVIYVGCRWEQMNWQAPHAQCLPAQWVFNRVVMTWHKQRWRPMVLMEVEGGGIPNYVSLFQQQLWEQPLCTVARQLVLSRCYLVITSEILKKEERRFKRKHSLLRAWCSDLDVLSCLSQLYPAVLCTDVIPPRVATSCVPFPKCFSSQQPKCQETLGFLGAPLSQIQQGWIFPFFYQWFGRLNWGDFLQFLWLLADWPEGNMSCQFYVLSAILNEVLNKMVLEGDGMIFLFWSRSLPDGLLLLMSVFSCLS